MRLMSRELWRLKVLRPEGAREISVMASTVVFTFHPIFP